MEQVGLEEGPYGGATIESLLVQTVSLVHLVGGAHQGAEVVQDVRRGRDVPPGDQDGRVVSVRHRWRLVRRVKADRVVPLDQLRLGDHLA